IRQFEFIRYDLAKHNELLASLDNAIQYVFVGRYAEFYEKAKQALQEFGQFAGVNFEAVSVQEFQARVMRGERKEVLPDTPAQEQLLEFLLPKIIADLADMQTMRKISEWLRHKFPAQG